MGTHSSTYTYGDEAPTLFVDPSGLFTWSNLNPFSDDFGGKHNPVKLRVVKDPLLYALVRSPIVPVPKHGTAGACVGGHLQAGLGIQTSGCLVYSSHETGLTFTAGGTLGRPAYGVSATAQLSNALCLSKLGKWFYGGGATAARGTAA